MPDPPASETVKPVGQAEQTQTRQDNQGPLPRPEIDVTGVIQRNDELPALGFPSTSVASTTAPPVTPIVLQSLSELDAVVAPSRTITGFSNFAEASESRHSARRPRLPTAKRFASLSLFQQGIDSNTLAPSSTKLLGDSLYDLSFPVHLEVTDGRRMPLPGTTGQNVVDALGYPLFYDVTRVRPVVPVRSSGAIFPVAVSRGVHNRLNLWPDLPTIRAWSHMFQLSNDADAIAIVTQRIKADALGDNHVALLVKAYLAYLDSIAATLDGVEAKRNAVSPADVIVDVSKDISWVQDTLRGTREVVNVLGGPAGYQEFWAFCCFDKPPIYSAKVTADHTATTPFSHYELGYGAQMICLCNSVRFSEDARPAFFGRPDLILGYIESYVQNFSLQRQANEALQIAMLWPTLYELKAHISLPKPFHTADWLGGEVEKVFDETAYSELVASGPIGTLASVQAGACALKSQIYDFISLIVAQRTAWKPTDLHLQLAINWFQARASAPGAGWDFLLRHQFDISPSFLYLTGLGAQALNWQATLEGFKCDDVIFPAHLRLLQPFWTVTSVSCLLPWEITWRPAFETEGPLMIANAGVIMALLKLGIFNKKPLPLTIADLSDAVVPLPARAGSETIKLDPIFVPRLNAIRDHGLRVMAVRGTPVVLPVAQTLTSSAPVDDDAQIQQAWSKAISG